MGPLGGLRYTARQGKQSRRSGRRLPWRNLLVETSEAVVPEQNRAREPLPGLRDEFPGLRERLPSESSHLPKTAGTSNALIQAPISAISAPTAPFGFPPTLEGASTRPFRHQGGILTSRVSGYVRHFIQRVRGTGLRPGGGGRKFHQAMPRRRTYGRNHLDDFEQGIEKHRW